MNGQRGRDTIYFGRGTDIVVGGEGRDLAIASNGFSKDDAVELIEIAGDAEVNGVYLRNAGRYVVVENRSGRQSYIHESMESISSRLTNGQIISFQDLWEAVRFEVRDPDQEATREHFLMGTDRSEDFYGGAGRDTITGAGGKDKFHLDVFDRSADTWTNMDRILDLDSNDKIVIHSSLLGINPEDAGFGIVSNNRERVAAMRDGNVHFVYDTRSEVIFWDSNGANAGGGKGLAKLVGNSEFSGINQIEFI